MGKNGKIVGYRIEGDLEKLVGAQVGFYADRKEEMIPADNFVRKLEFDERVRTLVRTVRGSIVERFTVHKVGRSHAGKYSSFMLQKEEK